MDTLILKPTKTNPYICLDPSSQKYEISGQSFPEDPQTAFSPIFKWLEDNLAKLNHKMELHLQADYFNSASNRLLLKMFRLMEIQVQAGKEIEIIWRYDDEEIQNDGIIFSRIVSIPFQFVYNPVEDD
ncbi:MAG: DUF1987 domain-containing protein [Salinivirgaceae bacterium]|jgi:hypothetical protein|nr:DUF1987 domain-containing protein [Salinivirgaceae bacterium]